MKKIPLIKIEIAELRFPFQGTFHSLGLLVVSFQTTSKVMMGKGSSPWLLLVCSLKLAGGRLLLLSLDGKGRSGECSVDEDS
jgi:hypothetical protein